MLTWWLLDKKKWLIPCAAILCVILVMVGVLFAGRRINPATVDKIQVYGYELDTAETKNFIRLINRSRFTTRFPGGELCTPEDYIFVYFRDGSYLKICENGIRWNFEMDYMDENGRRTDKKRVYIDNDELEKFVEALAEKYGQT